jgi:hypothetical protein
MAPRNQKITLGEMRASGVRGLLIYRADYKRSHRTSGERFFTAPVPMPDTSRFMQNICRSPRDRAA